MNCQTCKFNKGLKHVECTKTRKRVGNFELFNSVCKSYIPIKNCITCEYFDDNEHWCHYYDNTTKEKCSCFNWKEQRWFWVDKDGKVYPL